MRTKGFCKENNIFIPRTNECIVIPDNTSGNLSDGSKRSIWYEYERAPYIRKQILNDKHLPYAWGDIL